MIEGGLTCGMMGVKRTDPGLLEVWYLLDCSLQ